MSESTAWHQSIGLKVAVFVLGTILLGALLAPPLYWGGKTTVENGWLADKPVLDSLHGSMDRAKFSRYFNRAILAGALIMLFPTLRWLNRGKSEKRTLMERLQLQPNRYWWAHSLAGFFLAAVPFFLLAWLYLHQGWYEPRDAGKALLEVLGSAMGTAIAVALLEEFVFRGALTSIFSSLLRPWPLLISIAVFFAIVHFLKPPDGVQFGEVKAWSGFTMLGLIFSQFGDWYFLAAEFAVLFAVGMVLGYSRLRTGSLWLAIGLHAGWVFGVKTFSPLTKRAFEPAEMMPWLGGNLRTGLASAIVVTLTGLLLCIWLEKRKARKISA